MERIKEMVESHFEETIQEMRRLIGKGGEHLLLCGLDSEVVSIIVKGMEKYVMNSNMKAVFVGPATQKDMNPEGKAFFIKIQDSMSISYQSLIYYYLEKTRECSCSLVLISNSCLSLDGLEKRVKSRFNHRVFFLEFLSLESYVILYKKVVGEADRKEIERQYGINPSVSVLLKRSVMEKYKVPEYSVDMLYDLLSPIHIALIIIATKKRIRYISCVSEFKMFTTSVNELKKASSTEILLYFLDLLDSGVIDKEGDLLVDLNSFKRYVAASRPMYLRNLVYKNI